jgi:hypothetical protein
MSNLAQCALERITYHYQSRAFANMESNSGNSNPYVTSGNGAITADDLLLFHVDWDHFLSPNILVRAPEFVHSPGTLPRSPIPEERSPVAEDFPFWAREKSRISNFRQREDHNFQAARILVSSSPLRVVQTVEQDDALGSPEKGRQSLIAKLPIVPSPSGQPASPRKMAPVVSEFLMYYS